MSRLQEMLESQTPPGVFGSVGHKDPTSPDCAIPKALKELEEKHGARRIAKDAGYSVDALKKCWKI